MSDLTAAAVAAKQPVPRHAHQPQGEEVSEQWRSVVGFEGMYQVSAHGNVRSVDRLVRKRNGVRMAVRAKNLTPWLSHGYPTVTLRDGVSSFTRQVHVLVLEAFVGARPAGLEGCHGDGDPTNNRLSNLRWDTSGENKRDTVRHGNHHWASKRACPRGHELAGDNLVASSLKIGRRQCRACNQARAHARRHGLSYEDVADQMYAQILAGENA